MGSKGGGKQTTTNAPFKGQQPFLIDGFNQAKQLFDKGPQQFFPGQTVAGSNPSINQAENRLVQRSFGSPVVNAGQQFIQGQLQNSPQFGGAQSFSGQGGSFGQQAQQVGAGQQLGLDQANQQFQPQVTGLDPTAQGQLSSTAQGQNLNGNPFLDQTFDRGADRITKAFSEGISPQIAGQFSAAGRTGSDAALRAQTDAAEVSGDSLANFANQVYGGNYQQERDRQLQAAGQLGSLDQSQQGLGLQAAGQGANLFNQQQGQDIQRLGLGADLFNQDQSRALQAAGIDAGVFGQQLNQQTNALGQAIPFAEQDIRNIGLQQLVGNQQRSRQQQNINGARERFDFNQQAPQNALQNYIAAIQGNFGGTTTSRSQASSGSRLGGAANGAIAGAPFGPIGAIAGGIGGLLSA